MNAGFTRFVPKKGFLMSGQDFPGRTKGFHRPVVGRLLYFKVYFYEGFQKTYLFIMSVIVSFCAKRSTAGRRNLFDF